MRNKSGPAGILDAIAMNKPDNPVIIKKYANRRLYNTGTSTYVTLEDLAAMVKKGEDFAVYDAKTGEDITRSVLTQIIFEQENKGTQNLLPITFLRQLIRFYGDSMQTLVPRFLESASTRWLRSKSASANRWRRRFAGVGFGAFEEQVRRNMEMFERAFAMFVPFARREDQAAAKPRRERRKAPGGELDAARSASSKHPPCRSASIS